MRPQFLPNLFAPVETQPLIAAVPALFERRETFKLREQGCDGGVLQAPGACRALVSGLTLLAAMRCRAVNRQVPEQLRRFVARRHRPTSDGKPNLPARSDEAQEDLRRQHHALGDLAAGAHTVAH